MQLPDEGVIQCFIDCTRLPMSVIKGYQKQFDSGNHRDIKLLLAEEIVRMYHGESTAKKAKQDWIAQVSEKKIAEDVKTLPIPKGNFDLIKCIVEVGGAESTSQARRLIDQGAVRINESRIEDINTEITLKNGDILHIGKKYTFKFIAS
jgi:tyrosyl-tRNA synthetase